MQGRMNVFSEEWGRLVAPTKGEGMADSFAVIEALSDVRPCFDPDCIQAAKFKASVLDGRGKVAIRTDGCLEHFGICVSELYQEYVKISDRINKGD